MPEKNELKKQEKITQKKVKHTEKPEAKPAETVKVVKKKEKLERARIEKPAELKKLQELIKKKWHPVFRGRFGSKKWRRVKDDKWNKWRKPRGIDIVKRKEDGMIPRTGYGTPAIIRHRHPSGYYAVLVKNASELSVLAGAREKAAVIGGNVGKRKRKEMLRKADEMKIVVLNR